MTSPLPVSRNQRILIIDDNAAIHDDIRKILGAPTAADSELDAEAAELFGGPTQAAPELQFEIDSAFQGQDGLDLVHGARERQRPYAVAFVDVRMPPGWDGVETVSRIWKVDPELQIVICTAYSDYSWDEMIRLVGKTDNLVILKKPFDNVEVLQLAHTLTQKWTLNHQLHCHLSSLDEMVASRTAELEAANRQLRQEIDERRHAQKRLVESEERFARAFQLSPIPMALQCLRSERFIDVNDAFVAICGVERMEILGSSPAELNLCPDPQVQAELFAQLRSGKSVRDYACTVSSRTSGVRECVVSAEAFPLGTGMVSLIATMDVTEQRSLEEQLRHSQKLEAVGQFAAGVAHDFNNVLTVVQGHATMQLKKEGLGADLAESLEQISSAAERAATLTRRLLTFSRKQVVQPRPLSLSLVVYHLQEMLRRVIGEHITLTCRLNDSLPAVFADQSNLEQIIMNLAVNARDAMPDGGELTITTAYTAVDEAHVARHPQAKAGLFVHLSVTDNGCGMSAETLAHIFEPFFTTKDVGKGTGLGLATVYGIVAQHGGWLEVTSRLGHGSTFHIYLPGSTATAESAAPAPSTQEVRGGHETLLVVEDELTVREIMIGILKHAGYCVVAACDGPEALAQWAEHKAQIDMLLTDIVMPNGLRGNLLAERLWLEKPELKVIFSSGYSSDFGTEADPLPAQAHFLEKPFRPEVLLQAVRDCLDG